MQKHPHGGVRNAELVGDELIVVSKDGEGNDLPLALGELLGTGSRRVVPARQKMPSTVANGD